MQRNFYTYCPVLLHTHVTSVPHLHDISEDTQVRLYIVSPLPRLLNQRPHNDFAGGQKKSDRNMRAITRLYGGWQKNCIYKLYQHQQMHNSIYCVFYY
jgi:hypothetical protein